MIWNARGGDRVPILAAAIATSVAAQSVDFESTRGLNAALKICSGRAASID
jgi:hypothetical protein